MNGLYGVMHIMLIKKIFIIVGLCSSTCGAGVRRRIRKCQSDNCLGNNRESAICNQAICNNNDATWGGIKNIICSKNKKNF